MIHPTQRTTWSIQKIIAITAVAFLLPAPMFKAMIDMTNPKMIKIIQTGSTKNRQTTDAISRKVNGMYIAQRMKEITETIKAITAGMLPPSIFLLPCLDLSVFAIFIASIQLDHPRVNGNGKLYTFTIF
jgi:hypothetical protein